ncbi:hypothetical protein ACYSNR_03485 [Enterococcus sp. LJL128]
MAMIALHNHLHFRPHTILVYAHAILLIGKNNHWIFLEIRKSSDYRI